MTRRFIPALAIALIATLTSTVHAQTTSEEGPLALLSYVCPMPADADVIEDKPGTCPKCGMRLRPVRLETTWTCPIHGAIHQDKAGTCPIDRRELIQVTMSVSWACKGEESESLAAGRCPDGSAMVKRYSPRPHGNHNPQHGGQFFMAPDNWHHLEGAHPAAGRFRLYFYDDYTKPLSRDRMRGLSAKLIVGGRAYSLALPARGNWLDATIPNAPLPATMQAKVRFDSGVPETVFDFTFADFSKDPVSVAPTVTRTAAPVPPMITAPVRPTVGASTMSAPAAAATPPAAASGTPGVEALTLSQTIPQTVPEILATLRTRTDQIRNLIDKGLFGEVYVPAFQAKDLAVALETREVLLPEDRRQKSEAALATIVRDAYLLDAFGDLGNKQQISDAYADFAAAAKDIQSSLSETRP